LDERLAKENAPKKTLGERIKGIPAASAKFVWGGETGINARQEAINAKNAAETSYNDYKTLQTQLPDATNKVKVSAQKAAAANRAKDEAKKGMKGK
jgi:hypothetical protein